MTITLLKHDLDWCMEMAEKTLALFPSGGHYDNNINSHLTGRLGELAVDTWLVREGFRTEPFFRDIERSAACDLKCNDLRLEIKTWSLPHWFLLGRCVRPGQLKSIQDKSDAVVWCSVQEMDSASATIEIRGWNSVREISSLPVTVTRKLDNHQMPLERIHRLSLLLDKLRA